MCVLSVISAFRSYLWSGNAQRKLAWRRLSTGSGSEIRLFPDGSRQFSREGSGQNTYFSPSCRTRGEPGTTDVIWPNVAALKAVAGSPH